jgi:hypothetical protein
MRSLSPFSELEIRPAGSSRATSKDLASLNHSGIPEDYLGKKNKGSYSSILEKRRNLKKTTQQKRKKSMSRSKSNRRSKVSSFL